MQHDWYPYKKRKLGQAYTDGRHMEQVAFYKPRREVSKESLIPTDSLISDLCLAEL